MFFRLSNQQENNFSFHYTLPCGLVLNTDDGWESYTLKDYTVIVKGYTNQYSLSDIVSNLTAQDIPEYRGNFCAFVATTDYVRILHDKIRSFPLWINNECVTNLDSQGEQIWSDQVLTVNKNLKIINRSYINVCDREPYEITDDQIVDTIHNRMCETYEQFLSHNDKPLKMFLSGGIDTTTCWAYLEHFTKKYELVDYEYIKFTPFWKKNNPNLKSMFWGYTQIHLWDENCVLISGAGGCYFLRNPTDQFVSLALKAVGVTFNDVVKPGDYYYQFYINWVDPNNEPPYPGAINMTKEELHNHIINRYTNDYQHWHIDKTLTFTPLRNTDFSSLILQGSKDLLIKQTTNSFINRELIRRLDPDKLDKISASKNLNAKAYV